MSNAISSFGTLLKRGAVTIAEVRDVTGPSLQQSTAEVTNHSSPGRYREFLATVIDGGEVTFEIGYVPSEATHGVAAGGLLDDMENGNISAYSVTFPDTTAWSFSAIVTGFEPSAPVDGALTANVTFKVAGQPTLA